MLAGAAAAPALVLVGLAVGFVEGGLLPGDCRGLACIFTGILLTYAGLLLALWVVFAGVLALARRRWPRSSWRLALLRVLAAASWLLPLAPVVLALT